MNQSVKLKRMQTHFEKVFDRSMTMSHLGWMMMRICIIYNKDIQVKGRLLPPRTISIVEKAEPTRKKGFAEIHIKNNNLKYVESAKQIL